MALAAVEALRSAHLLSKGVRESAIAASAAAPAPAAKPGHIRLLQWNILADGMSQDGFLVSDVLADWPAGEGKMPDSSGKAADMVEVARQFTAARELPQVLLEPTLKEFAASYNTTAASTNFAAVVDWQGRVLRMEAEIIAMDPDIIAMQEVDHFEQLGRLLAKRGYECGMHGALERYRKIHEANLPRGDAEEYLRHLQDAGVAFAPNSPSSCRPYALKLGIVDPDDDGVALFWKKDSFELEALEFLTYPQTGPPEKTKQKGAVKAVLKHKKAPGIGSQELHVIAAHLSSGDSADDERGRIKRELLAEAVVLAPGAAAPVKCDGLRSWFAASVAAGQEAILVLDANATPDIRPKMNDGDSTAWSLLRRIDGVSSIWDAWYDPEGRVKKDAPQPVPVTTNKLRGPLTDQTKKIGLHAYYLIDHVYYGNSRLKLAAHVREPLAYASSDEALAHLLPTLAVPSDHAPVVVDLEVLPGQVRLAAEEQWQVAQQRPVWEKIHQLEAARLKLSDELASAKLEQEQVQSRHSQEVALLQSEVELLQGRVARAEQAQKDYMSGANLKMQKLQDALQDMQEKVEITEWRLKETKPTEADPERRRGGRTTWHLHEKSGAGRAPGSPAACRGDQANRCRLLLVLLAVNCRADDPLRTVARKNTAGARASACRTPLCCSPLGPPPARRPPALVAARDGNDLPHRTLDAAPSKMRRPGTSSTGGSAAAI